MATPEQQQQQQDNSERRKRIELLNDADFKAIVNTPEGRRFCKRVLAECGVYQLSFTAGQADSLTIFKEGRRSIGLWLQSLFVDTPDQYIQLLTEENNG